MPVIKEKNRNSSFSETNYFLNVFVINDCKKIGYGNDKIMIMNLKLTLYN